MATQLTTYIAVYQYIIPTYTSNNYFGVVGYKTSAIAN